MNSFMYRTYDMYSINDVNDLPNTNNIIIIILHTYTHEKTESSSHDIFTWECYVQCVMVCANRDEDDYAAATT